MTKHQDVAKALKARLSELKRRVAEIDRELHTQLSADSEEQAIDLENQEALGAIENFGVQEIHRIEQTLKRISEGTYGICARCGAVRLGEREPTFRAGNLGASHRAVAGIAATTRPLRG
jgi:RNA polymerase-binding transcription factor DksA